MKHIDLFSGIGGFALAARRAGIKTVQFVEINPFCQKILRKNFPGVPIHDDIKNYKYTGEHPFVLTGGFPCQPYSCAGKRRGEKDDRALWHEMLRVISETKPTWIIGENVIGFVGMGLDNCISNLEAEGYEAQAFIIPACAVNAPHRRDRVWIVAHASRKRLPRSERLETYYDEGQATYGSVAKRNMFWDEPWIEAATRLCRVDDGVSSELYKLETSNRVARLKALGNAIVPQVAFEIMEAIVISTHSGG